MLVHHEIAEAGRKSGSPLGIDFGTRLDRFAEKLDLSRLDKHDQDYLGESLKECNLRKEK